MHLEYSLIEYSLPYEAVIVKHVRNNTTGILFFLFYFWYRGLPPVPKIEIQYSGDFYDLLCFFSRVAHRCFMAKSG